jgi:hypothetical protein
MAARNEPGEGPGLGEALVVWILYGLAALAIVVTYWRLPVAELYNTSEGGLRGGLGRALVYVNFPGAFVALAVLGLVAGRARSRVVDVLALVSAALCVVVFVPGVVEQSDLDAKPVNVLPALGVALALALTFWTLRTRGIGLVPRRVSGDVIRVVLTVVLVLASIPWIAAELGFYADLGGIFFTSAVVPEPGHPGIHAVHLGHHHGLDGTMFAVTALLLSRELGRFTRPRLRAVVAGYLAFMFVYGLANAFQDFWSEQLWKRDVTSVKIPAMIRPDLTLGWLVILLGAAAVFLVVRRSDA